MLGPALIAIVFVGCVVLLIAGRNQKNSNLTVLGQGGLVLIAGAAVLGVFVAGPAPHLSPHPSRARGDTRSVLLAQFGYASINHGLYEGRLDCLSIPSDCVPGYPKEAPVFIEPATEAEEVRSAYKRSLHPRSPPNEIPEGASLTSIQAFAFVAVPVEEGFSAYCGDSTGRICQTKDGSMPVVRDGQCVVGEGSLFYWFTDEPAPCTLIQ